MSSNMQTIIAQKLVLLYDMGIVLSCLVIIIVIMLLILLMLSIIITKLITYMSTGIRYIISFCTKPFTWLYNRCKI